MTLSIMSVWKKSSEVMPNTDTGTLVHRTLRRTESQTSYLKGHGDLFIFSYFFVIQFNSQSYCLYNCVITEGCDLKP